MGILSVQLFILPSFPYLTPTPSIHSLFPRGMGGERVRGIRRRKGEEIVGGIGAKRVHSVANLCKERGDGKGSKDQGKERIEGGEEG